MANTPEHIEDQLSNEAVFNQLVEEDDVSDEEAKLIELAAATLQAPIRYQLVTDKDGVKSVVKEVLHDVDSELLPSKKQPKRVSVRIVKYENGDVKSSVVQAIDNQFSRIAKVHSKTTVGLGLKPLEVLNGDDIDLLRTLSEEEVESKEVSRSSRDGYLTAEMTARYLGVAKSTVTRKISKNEIIGIRDIKKEWRIPKGQFADRVLVTGVSNVLEQFENDHFEAWTFLNTRFLYGEDQETPLDLLRVSKSNLSETLELIETFKESFERGDFQ